MTQFAPDFDYKDAEGMNETPRIIMHMREEDDKIYVNAEEYEKSANMWRSVFEELDDILEREGNEYVIYDWKMFQEDVIPYVGSTVNLVFPNEWISLPAYKNGTSKTEYLNLFIRNDKAVYISPNYYPDPFFPDVIANDIELPTSTPDNDSKIYNLQGQRILRPQRGLNIVGGRKVWVK